MDLNYIEENNLTEARNRFKQINEYILKMNGENEEQQDNSAQEQTGDAAAQEPMPNDMPPQQQPQEDAASQPQEDAALQPQGDVAQQPQGAEGQQPQDDLSLDPTIGAEAGTGAEGMAIEDPTMAEPSIEGDEVIDVDDLTQSQETTEYKIDGVDDKISKLIDIVSKFGQAIEDNDEKINDLKRELEERNPSQEERLNIRSMSGSPYTVNPHDYWADQNARNPQYNVIADNNVDPDKEEDLYTITDDDVKNFNKSEIEKSISDYPKNLKDLF